MSDDSDLLFDAATPLGFTVRTSRAYSRTLLLKHPDLVNRQVALQRALEAPEEVRRSRRDANVLLFYRRDAHYWLVAVARRLDGDGFLVTAYRTDAIKEGETLWRT